MDAYSTITPKSNYNFLGTRVLQFLCVTLRVGGVLYTVKFVGGSWRNYIVWLHIIRFSFSQKANEEQSLILVLVSQLKRKKGY